MKEVTRFYLDFVRSIPDELTTALFYWTAPPAPFLPESIHGKRVALIASCYAGAAEGGESVVALIRALGPEVDLLGPMPYTALNAMFDPLLPKGTLSYAKSDYFDGFTEAAIDEMIAWAERKPAPLSLTHLSWSAWAVSYRSGDGCEKTAQVTAPLSRMVDRPFVPRPRALPEHPREDRSAGSRQSWSRIPRGNRESFRTGRG